MKITSNVYVSTLKQISKHNNHCFWLFNEKSVCWAPYKSYDEKEQHIQSTLGSYDITMCFPNEFRFNAESLILESVSLYVPEETLSEEEYNTLKDGLLARNTYHSGFKLNEKIDNFKFELANKSIYDKDSDMLIGTSDFLLRNISHTDLHFIDKSLGLFFTKENLSGWQLNNASSKLSIDYKNVSNEDSSRLLEIYYSVFNSFCMALMESESGEMKSKLLGVIEDLKGNFETKNQLVSYILDAIENCLDFYYE